MVRALSLCFGLGLCTLLSGVVFAGELRPLAQFVGYRAGGLGGAQVSIAEGGSAVLWNPGALGFTRISEIDLGHGSVSGSGAETYSFALTVASARGTAGASFRTSTLVDSESEVEARAAYGQRVSGSWSVGGALTLRRTGPDGMKTSAAGLDLGTAVRPGTMPGSPGWLDRTSLGLTLWNAVEPAFDRTGASTEPSLAPLVIGLGTAKQFLPWERGHLLLALDVRVSRGRSVTTHAGVEFTWSRALALRSGLDDGSPTAGIGLEWRHAALDYAFTRAGSQTEHRVGVHWTLASIPDWTDRRRDALSQRAFDANRHRVRPGCGLESRVSAGGVDDRLDDTLLQDIMD